MSTCSISVYLVWFRKRCDSAIPARRRGTAENAGDGRPREPRGPTPHTRIGPARASDTQVVVGPKLGERPRFRAKVNVRPFPWQCFSFRLFVVLCCPVTLCCYTCHRRVFMVGSSTRSCPHPLFCMVAERWPLSRPKSLASWWHQRWLCRKPCPRMPFAGREDRPPCFNYKKRNWSYDRERDRCHSLALYTLQDEEVPIGKGLSMRPVTRWRSFHKS